MHSNNQTANQIAFPQSENSVSQSQPSQLTFNHVFGIDVFSQIISYLDAASLKSVAQVSKDFRQLVRTISLTNPKSHPTLLIFREIEAIRTLRNHIGHVTDEVEYLAETRKKISLFDLSSDLKLLSLLLALSPLLGAVYIGERIYFHYRPRYEDPLKIKWFFELWDSRGFKHPLADNSWDTLMNDLQIVAEAVELFKLSSKKLSLSTVKFFSWIDVRNLQTQIAELRLNGKPKTKEEAIKCLETFSLINQELEKIKFTWRNDSELSFQYTKAPLGLFNKRLFIKKEDESQKSLVHTVLKKIKLK